MKHCFVTACLLTIGAVTILAQSGAGADPPTVARPRPGTFGIRLVAVAGGASNNPLARSYVVDRLAPGTRLSRTVQIDNDGSKYIDVAVYVAAANVIRGAFVFAPGRTTDDLAGWTSLSHRAIRIAPHAEVFDTVITKVPFYATEGNDYAVVWAAVSAPPPSGRGITLVSRVGVRMYVAIGPGGGAPSNFVLGVLSAQRSLSGRSLVVTTIRNSGPNTLDLNGSLKFSHGPGGLHAGPFAADLKVVLAPGSTEPVRVALASGFPRGPWRADLRIKSGSLSRTRIDTITFPVRYASSETASRDGFLLQLFVLVIVLIGGAVLALLSSRRVKRRVPLRSTSEQSSAMDRYSLSNKSGSRRDAITIDDRPSRQPR